MIGKRSFLKQIAGFAAIVALAPQLAFRVIPDTPRIKPPDQILAYWHQCGLSRRYYSKEYLEALKSELGNLDDDAGWSAPDGVDAILINKGIRLK